MITKSFSKDSCFLDAPNVQPERFLTREEAIKRFDARDGAVPCEGDVSGFFFSLDILEIFMERIKTYNNDPAHTNKVGGVRIWQAKSNAFYGPATPPYAEKLVEDVILVPTRKDKSDFHAYPEGEYLTGPTPVLLPGEPSHTPLLILGSSRPCPNLCGAPEPFFHHYRRTTPLPHCP